MQRLIALTVTEPTVALPEISGRSQGDGGDLRVFGAENAISGLDSASRILPSDPVAISGRMPLGWIAEA